VGAEQDALYRVLRLLASEGLFQEVEPRVFATTETGELLRDGDLSARYVALMHGELMAPVFVDMIETVRTGMPIPQLRDGSSEWERLAADPEKSDIFNRAMRGRAVVRGRPLRLLDWAGIETVVDVGGGTGGILFPLLERESHLRGVLFDLGHVGDEARAAIASAGLDDRCRFEAGSFFEHVPTTGDAYLLSNILHDWGDEDALRILAACRAAMRDGSKLFVLESLLRDDDGPDPSRVLDVLMLVANGGRERTEHEYRDLLGRSGFALERIVGDGAVALEAVAV
jgi:SAM-dependent methyltransferase